MVSQNLAPDPYLDCFGDEVYLEWTRYNNSLAKFISELHLLLNIIIDIEKSSTSMLHLMTHSHSQHYHYDRHDVSNLDKVDSPMYHYKSDPPHSMFPKEKDCREDLDEDGTICGEDFLIVDGPPIYADMRYDPELTFPDNIVWHLFDDILAEENSHHPGSKINSGENPSIDPTSEGDGDIINSRRQLDYTPAGLVDSGLLETNVSVAKDISSNTIVRNLINELIHGTDQDGNTLIYNVDFYIPNSDSKKPLVLKNIENTSNITKSDEVMVVSMDYFLSTINIGEYSSDVSTPISIPGKLVSEIIDCLINETVDVVDLDGDGLIYGKDFIIIGDNVPLKLKSKYPAVMPDIILTWNTYLQYSLVEFNGQRLGIDYIEILYREYIENKDLDDNGLIYGVDFIFDPNHPNLPPDTFKYLPKLTSPKSLMKSWNWYILNLSSTPDVPVDQNLDELSVKFATEYTSGVDVDGDGLIYGHNFVISDYDDSKTDCIWRLESSMNLIRDTEVYKDIARRYLPKAVTTEFTIQEWNRYWGINEGDPGYKTEFSCSQCLNIERQIGTSSIINGVAVLTPFKFQKFAILMSWSDISAGF